MRGEDIYEEGIVTATERGSATVAILKSDSCEECSAKIFCGVGEKNENSVEACDPFGVHVGDSVRILIRGESLLAASGLLYGIPLVLIIAGIFVGSYVYNPGFIRRELWSCLLGIGLAGIYYLVIFINTDVLRHKNLMPNIVSVREHLIDGVDERKN